MKQCERGHFFDEARYPQCPYCKPESAPVGSTVAVQANTPVGKTVGVEAPKKRADAGKTVGVLQKKISVDPAVAFLICVEGAHKGEDFKLVSGRNFIGRDNGMDIALTNDDTVSRENHALITYDVKYNKFLISPGMGRGVTYLNEALVEAPLPLNAFDTIEVGSCKLKFLPFCGKEFIWE